MKTLFALLVGATMSLGLLPSQAEAATVTHSTEYTHASHSDREVSRRHRRDHDRREYRHQRHSRRVYHPGHAVYRHGHRTWIPARTVVITF